MDTNTFRRFLLASTLFIATPLLLFAAMGFGSGDWTMAGQGLAFSAGLCVLYWWPLGGFLAAYKGRPRLRWVLGYLVSLPLYFATLAALYPLFGATFRPTSASYAASPQPRFAGRQVQPSPEVLHFDIASELLDSVIPEFERVSGIHVVFSKSGLGGVLSSGVHGEYTSDQALQQILAGTGLMFRHTASNTVTLDVSPVSESVDVTTATPGISVASAKYTAPLSSVPQTIEVIPQQVLAEQGVTTLSEALRNVPGITLQAGEGGCASKTGDDMFNLRGFNASNSIFVDGVRDDGLIGRDVFNLEQVEVFMGPTGSDVGRGTAGGYVNMVAKSPQADPTYSAQYELGSANHRRLSTDLGSALPFGTSGGWRTRAAGRMNALWQDSGIPGRGFVKQNRQAIAPAITIGLGTPTRFTLAAEALRQNNIPDYGLSGAAWSRNQLTATTVRAGQAVNQSNYYGSPGYDYDKGSQGSYTARFERDTMMV
jgi:catecholate siderophore receptor